MLDFEMLTMTELEKRVIKILRRRGPISASYIGEELWERRSHGDPLPQRFARPAGRILQRMKRTGLVYQRTDLKWTVV